jgi:hypothetical protein
MLFFNNEKQEQILLNNLPTGRAFKKAYQDGTNFNNVIKWIASQFEWLVNEYNKYFKGLFICQSSFFIEEFKKDFLIPNEIFYQTTIEEHTADIKVIKYLMWGNTKFHYEAIASQYGICVNVATGVAFSKNSRLPNKIPHILFDEYDNINNIVVITIYSDGTDVLPHFVPHILKNDLKLEKLIKIYDFIKPAQVKIIYQYESEDKGQCQVKNLCVKV